MLAILATHPIQYQIPIWRQLADGGRVSFEVWYLTAHGVRASHDKEFGQSFMWDFPLLDGYPYRFVPDPVPDELGGVWDVGLGADFRARLQSGEINALLVAGWNVRACWEAVFLAHFLGIQVWMRGESNDLKVDRGIKRIGKRWLLNLFFNRVDRFLCIGAANRRLYQSYSVCEERLLSGPYCVDNGRFADLASSFRPQRMALRRAWGIPDGAYCLLYAAKFIPKKRPLDLIVAVRRLMESDPTRTYHILFVGAGLLGDEMRRLCQVMYDAAGKVISVEQQDTPAPHASYTGFLNQSEIPKAYVAADALVLASDAEETWGLVVNEAMASGLPAIVSDACGSAEDLVVPLDSRLSFPCGDVAALAEAIRWLAYHPISPSTIAERIARYDIGATVETVERLWSAVLVGHGSNVR